MGSLALLAAFASQKVSMMVSLPKINANEAKCKQ